MNDEFPFETDKGVGKPGRIWKMLGRKKVSKVHLGINKTI